MRNRINTLGPAIVMAARTSPIGPGAIPAVCQSLESRTMLSVTPGTAARLVTSLGPVDIELFAGLTPLTVANFLNYVNSGAYANTLIHRSVPGFIVQGGGYDSAPPFDHISTNPPVVNEFSSATTNTRGRLSMAKSAGDPNSATSEWFVNLGDNSANLDTQNGGFTAFGQVLGSGMRIVDLIAALPTYQFQDPFGDIPLRNYSSFPNTPQADNFVTVDSASQEQVMTVVLGDTTERAVSFQDANGTTATISLVGSGELTLKLVGSGLASSTDGSTYTITGSAVQLLEMTASGLARNSQIATQATGGTGVVDSGTLNISTGGDVHAIAFTDGSGTSATARLNGGGLVTARLAGQNLNVIVRNGTAQVTGPGIALNELDTTATGAHSTLAIAARGGTLAVGGIFCDGPVLSINAPGAALNSAELSVQGSLGRLRLGGMNHALVNINGSTGSLNASVGSVADSTLNTTMPISQMRASVWLNTDGGSDMLAAPSIGRLVVNGDCGADLTLNGSGQTMQSAKVSGTASGDWKLSGNAGSITAGATSGSFTANVTAGNIAKLKIGDMSGTFNAVSITNVAATSLHDASIVLTQAVGAAPALRRLVAHSAITSTLIDATGDIGSIVAPGLISSRVYAGVGSLASGQVLPASAADLTGPAIIGSLRLHAARGVAAFVNSSVAASQIVSAYLGLIATDNSGTTFGLAAERLGVFSGVANVGFRFTNITTTQQLASDLNSRGVQLGDMQVIVLS